MSPAVSACSWMPLLQLLPSNDEDQVPSPPKLVPSQTMYSLLLNAVSVGLLSDCLFGIGCWGAQVLVFGSKLLVQMVSS